MQRLALTAFEIVWQQPLTPKPLSPSTLVRCHSHKTKYELSNYLSCNVNDDVWILGVHPNGLLSKVNVFLLWSQVTFVSSDTREAGLLFNYAKEVSESGCLDQDESIEDETGEGLGASSPVLGPMLNELLFLCAVDSITNVYTISKLKKKAQENPETFFGITYSFVSKLDLDSSLSRVIRSRWWVHLLASP